MDPIVSIICVCHNDRKWFARFFQSVREQTIFDWLEIIMVDNVSADGSPELLTQELATCPQGQLVQTGGDYGYGVGCNRGAAKARGKYLFFVNPDIWFETDCLQQLVRQAERSTAAVFTLTELPYQNELPKGSIFGHGQGAAGFDIFGCLVGPRPDEKLKQPFAVGSFYFIRKKVFDQLGGFDSKFYLYNEEMDLSWRARIAGETVESIPHARLHHASICPAIPPPARTKADRRFFANRSQLLTILKNSQGLLLLTAFTYLVLITVEAMAGAIAARQPSFIYWSLLKPVADCWRLRFYLLDQRKQIKIYRKRGDWWFIRHFLRFGFSHWQDIKRFIKPRNSLGV
ncbi:MAG: glycosyltransferase family 2 protein [Verrucomicrobiota bacterium]